MDAILAAVDELAPRLVELLQELVRIPTVNPPGDGYEDLHISSIHREAWDSNYARRITGNSTPMNTTSLGDDEQATDRP